MRTDDECYTGTGLAAEVANGWGKPCYSEAAAHAGQANQGQPAYAELLAQRDELARKLNMATSTLEEIGAYRGEGPTCTTPWQDIVRDLGELARAALSHIKGA